MQATFHHPFSKFLPSRTWLLAPVATLLLITQSGCEALIAALLDSAFTHHSSHVTGRVIGPDNRPVAGCRVDLTVPGGEWVDGVYRSVVIQHSTTTDDYGYFTLQLSADDMDYIAQWRMPWYRLDLTPAAFYQAVSVADDNDLSGDPNLGSFVLPYGS